MATVATWDQAWTVVQYCVQGYRETRELGGIATLNIDGIEENISDNIKGNNRQLILDAIRARRNELAEPIRNVRGWIGNCLWELRDVIGSTGVNARAIVDDLRARMEIHNTSGASVPSRNVTHGALTSGSTNAAKGASGATVMFVLRDKYGMKIEDGVFGPQVVMKCNADQSVGRRASGAETFRVFTSGVRARDVLISGTALPDGPEHRARAAEDASNILENGTFKETAPGATHKFTPWFTSNGVYTGINSFTTSAARIIRGSVGANALSGTWQALAISTATNALVQKITKSMDRNRPYPRYLWYRGVKGWDGTVVFQLGTHRVSASGSLDAWSVLATSGATSAAKNLYYDNFKQVPLLAQIWVNNRTAGAVLISTAYAGPADYYNGRFFIYRPGRSDAQIDDTWRWQDSETNSLGIQGVFNAAYRGGNNLPGLYFHHDPSSPTIADPA